MSLHRKTSSLLFRLIFMAMSTFIALILLSLNALFIIYIVFLPPLPSQLELGDNCLQNKRVLERSKKAQSAYIFPELKTETKMKEKYINHLDTPWYIFATPIIVQILFHGYFLDCLLSILYDCFCRFFEHSPATDIDRKSIKIFAFTCEQWEGMISFFSNASFAMVIVVYYWIILDANETERGIPCSQLIDVVQMVVAMIALCTRRNFAQKMACTARIWFTEKAADVRRITIKTATITSTRSREEQRWINGNEYLDTNTCCKLIFHPLVHDYWNVAAILVFLFGFILKTIDEWSLMNDRILSIFPLFPILLSKSECVCTPSSPCPIMYIVLAEFTFFSPIIYVRRVYQHWNGLRIQRLNLPYAKTEADCSNNNNKFTGNHNYNL